VSGNFSSHNNNVKRAFCDSPLISIITVVYNGQEFLEETILSIANQTYQGIEYIIIDGGSSDGTVDIIKKYEHVIDSWVSESDEGIYDAMNKGAKIANGSYISFLNASDTYLEDTAQKIADLIVKQECDYYCGPAIIQNQINNDSFISYPLVNFQYHKGAIMGMPAPHLSVFMKTEFFHDLHGYDLSFALSSDFDLLLRMTAHTNNVYYLQEPIGVFRLGGVSGSYRTLIDNFYVFKKHHVPLWTRIAHTAFYAIRLFLQNNLPSRVVDSSRLKLSNVKNHKKEKIKS
jgi:glycosyltransferase involved in cell wall biosynthesis|tara:strand:+ start:1685 stop:2548 length:864 start_codon:yes stop_codon:yes gene_type:complete